MDLNTTTMTLNVEREGYEPWPHNYAGNGDTTLTFDMLYMTIEDTQTTFNGLGYAVALPQ